MARKKTSKSVKIKMALLKAGVKQVDIAKRLGRGKSYVSEAIRGTFKSPEVSKIIKEITGIEL